jgi:hypothetical protein
MAKKNNYHHRMIKLMGMHQPGPGEHYYHLKEGINPNGRYVNSKYSNLSNFTFGFGVGDRKCEIEKIG